MTNTTNPTTTSPTPDPGARLRRRRLPARALLWTAVTALSTTAVGAMAVLLVSPEVRAGGQPASVATVNYLWWVGLLLCVPVYLASRRSVLLALPAVAVATVPQFAVATIGLNRMVADDGLEALIYVVPVLMTLACLLGALLGVVLRLVELRRVRTRTPG